MSTSQQWIERPDTSVENFVSPEHYTSVRRRHRKVDLLVRRGSLCLAIEAKPGFARGLAQALLAKADEAEGRPALRVVV